MKFNNNSNQSNAEKSGEFESSGFTIEAGPQAFQILSASLYSNKVQSVIRELSTNALDEHTSADVEQPFEVHLPTGFEPWFSIRDFGSGLSEHDATTLYTTFFKSTKRNSNAQIGCLGLGSKSPFAVTDSFTIESIHEGTRTVYTCYKDGGRPFISKIHSEETTEKSGVMIKFSVDSDHWEWEKEAKRVYRFFMNKPKLFNSNGLLEIDIELPKVLMQGEGWSIHDLNGNFAVMGNVAYPISFSSINTDDDEDSSIVRDLSSATGLIFRYPIGSINFLPSREGLEYDRTTKSAIISSAKSMRDDMIFMMTDSVESQPSLYKARVEYVTLKQKIGKFFPSVKDAKFSSKINSTIPTWGGKPIFDKLSMNNTLIKVDHLSFAQGKKSGSVAITNEFEFMFRYDNDSKGNDDDSKKNQIIFVCPKIKGHRERVRKYSSNRECRCFLLTSEQARVVADAIGHEGDPMEIFADASNLPVSRAKTFKIVAAEVTPTGLSMKGAGIINDDDVTWYCIRNSSANKNRILYIVDKDQLREIDLDNAIIQANKIGMKLPDKCVTMTYYEYCKKNVSSNGNMINIVDEIMKGLAKYINDNMGKAISEFGNQNKIFIDKDGESINDWLLEARDFVSERHPIKSMFPNLNKFQDWWIFGKNDKVLESICQIMVNHKKHLRMIVDGEVKNSEITMSSLNNMFLDLTGGIVKTNAHEIYGMVDISINAYGITQELSSVKKLKAKKAFELMAANPLMPKIEMDCSRAKEWSICFNGDIEAELGNAELAG